VGYTFHCLPQHWSVAISTSSFVKPFDNQERVSEEQIERHTVTELVPSA
jgi:hypothetical protein